MNSALNNRLKLPDTKPVFKTTKLSDYKALEEAVTKKPELIAAAKPKAAPIPPLKPKAKNISGWVIAGSVIVIGSITYYILKKFQES
ncbi:unnamed protein product [Rotaria sp. Silwood2]|nr:unnamed protein product [Rotaria sp. Silwood2]CAF4611071.1 unnamed protein product [Rotaria sp. Silwood2]